MEQSRYARRDIAFWHGSRSLLIRLHDHLAAGIPVDDTPTYDNLREFLALLIAHRSDMTASRRENRIWEHVDKREDGHWVWLGAGRNGPDDTGVARWRGKRTTAARVMWELENGPIDPDTYVVRNSLICDHSRCVNPAHHNASKKRRGREPGRPLGYFTRDEYGRPCCMQGHRLQREPTPGTRPYCPTCYQLRRIKQAQEGKPIRGAQAITRLAEHYGREEFARVQAQEAGRVAPGRDPAPAYVPLTLEDGMVRENETLEDTIFRLFTSPAPPTPAPAARVTPPPVSRVDPAEDPSDPRPYMPTERELAGMSEVESEDAILARMREIKAWEQRHGIDPYA